MTPIAFVGAGKMATAMIEGWLKNGSGDPRSLIVCSRQGKSAEALADRLGVSKVSDAATAVRMSAAVVLACKPQQIAELAASLRPVLHGQPVLSILAGTRLARLRTLLPEAGPIIRSMPNRPGQIGQGVTPYAPESTLPPEVLAWVEGVLSPLGAHFSIEERHLDAVTGISGSGPAYVFEFIAALRDGGIAEGLDSATSLRLALQTVSGAAALLEMSGDAPEIQRDAVVSPNGTTAAALARLTEGGFRPLVEDAVRAATRRSRELSSD
ncbi:MAG: pyrroline-5-carboxylate reductase [Opitutales bacterium]|nr:pyrroline-5-carboxylate reductase [Opitutales bacterium]